MRFRSVLVGDSFLEGFFVRAPLSAFVEQRLAAAGRPDMEAINFGVSATGPRQYYYRIKDVAPGTEAGRHRARGLCRQRLHLDAVRRRLLPPFIDELPLPSMLGAVAPRTTWLTVNRLGLSEVGRVNRGIAGEFALLNEFVQAAAGRAARPRGRRT